MTPELAWHFVGATLRDGRPVPADGEWLKHPGKIKMCETGLHASTRIFDALGFAPGPTVCRVALRGQIERGDDKLVASERLILWRVDATDVLRVFARKAALSVIHLWDAPDIVRQYLETGDESIRAAASAARAAAWDATWDATSAATSAAWAATSAATSAAWAATRAATSAAWDAAWDTALDELNAVLEALVREAAGNPDDAALLAKYGAAS